MAIFLVAFSLFMLIITGMNFIRLSRFSKFMKGEIDRVYQARIGGHRNVQYPNVGASYDNLKWYDVFNYRFDQLIVYDASPY